MNRIPTHLHERLLRRFDRSWLLGRIRGQRVLVIDTVGRRCGRWRRTPMQILHRVSVLQRLAS